MRAMLFGLFLKVRTLPDSQRYSYDGYQWVRILQLGPSRLLPGYEVGRRVRDHSWSGTHFNVFWQVVGLCAGDVAGILARSRFG